MSDHHESLSADKVILVVEESEDVVSFLVQNVRKSVEQVSESNYDVGLDSKLNLRFQQTKN